MAADGCRRHAAWLTRRHVPEASDYPLRILRLRCASNAGRHGNPAALNARLRSRAVAAVGSAHRAAGPPHARRSFVAPARSAVGARTHLAGGSHTRPPGHCGSVVGGRRPWRQPARPVLPTNEPCGVSRVPANGRLRWLSARWQGRQLAWLGASGYWLPGERTLDQPDVAGIDPHRAAS